MTEKKCWCGNSKLIPFSPAYFQCSGCGTLVTSEPIHAGLAKVTADARDFYGHDYWYSYQEKTLGFPNIEQRAKTDLSDRCPQWLNTLLKYRRPPARVLEIGCAHGGFVALLRKAGFDAMGLELSPSIVQFARDTFHVPVLCGPVEEQNLEPGSFDVIVMMDVLEHFPDPVKTLRHCLDLLKPDGLFLIQTPELPEEKNYETLLTGMSPFLAQLKSKEHLYLFSPSSVRNFFNQTGIPHLIFEPAVFAHYDMSFVASRKPIFAIHKELKCVAVDLTPLLPGGSNGGAKIVALELVKNLAGLTPDCEFVLLTSDKNHEELSLLETRNVKRLCMAHHQKTNAGKDFSLPLSRLRDLLANMVPDALLALVIQIYRSFFFPREVYGRLYPVKPDLLFCPFTAPFFFNPSVPTVSVIHEILFRHYPQFFSPESLRERDRHFQDTCRLADVIVCVSENLKQDVLKHTGLNPGRVMAVPNRLSKRLGDPSLVNGIPLLEKWGLEKNHYLLYPANFWPHKNHKMLLTAFGIFLAHHPDSRLKLACPGDPDTGMAPLWDAVKLMGLEKRIIFPGYASDSVMATLYKHCRALIYPSLYEGFGMPILEAQAFGKPVVAGNTTSIPEIAAPFAVLFDPRNPLEIANAIERTELPDAHAFSVPRIPHPRLEELSDPKLMALEYLEIFKNVLHRKKFQSSGHHLEGLYPDGWTSGGVIIFHAAGSGNRKLELSVLLPPSFPFPVAYLQLRQDQTKRLKIYLLRRGKNLRISWTLPVGQGVVELTTQPLFQPKAQEKNRDERWLGCFMKSCTLIEAGNPIKLYEFQGS